MFLFIMILPLSKNGEQLCLRSVLLVVGFISIILRSVSNLSVCIIDLPLALPSIYNLLLLGILFLSHLISSGNSYLLSSSDCKTKLLPLYKLQQ